MKDYGTDESILTLYLTDVRKMSILTEKEELDCIQKVKDGDLQARQKLISHNLPLVVNIALKYCKGELPLLDRIQEGNLGLMRAVSEFDIEKQCRFTTYATPWIHCYIRKALVKNYNFSGYIGQLLRKLSHEEQRLVRQLQRFPTLQELADAMRMSKKQIKRLNLLAQGSLSIDAPINEEEENSLGDILVDMTGEELYESVEQDILKEKLEQILQELPEKKQMILRRHYGLNGQPPETLDEIGKSLGVTRVAISQQERVLLKRLRCTSKVQALHSFVSR